MLCKTLIVNSEVKDIFIAEKGSSIPGIKVYPDYWLKKIGARSEICDLFQSVRDILKKRFLKFDFFLHLWYLHIKLFFLQVLLREGNARANATDNENSTPLHAASQEGKLNVVEILVRIEKDMTKISIDRVTIISWVRHDEGLVPTSLTVQFELFLRATGPVSRSNLSCWPLMSLAAKRAKLQAMILLPLETRKVASHRNFVIKAPSYLTQLIIVAQSNVY